jgi:fibro-slime domain-containing protein
VSLDGGAGGAGGATIPETSGGGAGGMAGATIPLTSGGGAGGMAGATISATSSGGAGGQASWPAEAGTDAAATDGPVDTLDSGPPAEAGAMDAVYRPTACGDGIVDVAELCDDGNTAAGDGCSPTCRVEIGYKCSGSPSVCIPTTCGDGVVEGAEGCDDGNTMPFDGCSADCQNEPNCNGDSCTSRCGDGIVLGEACDDGNNIDGDGCSKDCQIEAGFTCIQPPLGDKVTVPVVYRDFRFHNPSDFEPGSALGLLPAAKGMVETTLDGDRKPVYTGIGGYVYVASKDSFAKWYRNVDGVNHATGSKLTLWNNGKGAYVNRYGANGEQWAVTETAYWCGTVGSEINGQPCTYQYLGTAEPTNCTTKLATGETMLNCFIKLGSYSATFIVSKVDGNPLFFPVDDDNFTPVSERQAAQIPPLYDATGTYPYDVDGSGNKRLHNFSFTSEVRYWFLYDQSKSYTLDFTGDDDVWVFVNKKLAVDLGGIHLPVGGTVTIDATTAASFGLVDGNVYEVAVFQAERQTTGSSYKLTLTGFNAAASVCSRI